MPPGRPPDVIPHLKRCTIKILDAMVQIAEDINAPPAVRVQSGQAVLALAKEMLSGDTQESCTRIDAKTRLRIARLQHREEEYDSEPFGVPLDEGTLDSVTGNKWA